MIDAAWVCLTRVYAHDIGRCNWITAGMSSGWVPCQSASVRGSDCEERSVDAKCGTADCMRKDADQTPPPVCPPAGVVFDTPGLVAPSLPGEAWWAPASDWTYWVTGSKRGIVDIALSCSIWNEFRVPRCEKRRLEASNRRVSEAPQGLKRLGQNGQTYIWQLLVPTRPARMW